jgi:hypothetical protein
MECLAFCGKFRQKTKKKIILGGTGPTQPFFLIGEISTKLEIDNSKMK